MFPAYFERARVRKDYELWTGGKATDPEPPMSPARRDYGIERLKHMQEFLQVAIAEARQGLAEGGIPIGAALVHQNKVLGRGHNQRVQKGSAILHGEMAALENAGRQPASVYAQSTMVTTLSPCAMCSGAMLLYGINHVVIGENFTFMGEEELLRRRGVTVEVLDSEECRDLMTRFIAEHPELWNEDIGV